MLARLREVAPNLRLDAMGHVAGFGTLARWPEGLLEEFDANERAIREALRAEKRAASETTPEAAPSKKP